MHNNANTRYLTASELDAENARHENARNAIVWNTACCICLSIAEQECISRQERAPDFAANCVLVNAGYVQSVSHTCIIGGMYRHPGQNLDKFTNVLENTMIQIRQLHKPCLIAGDFNIDLLKYNKHQITNNYIENLLLYNFLPKVVMPTRISETSATVIDHIYFSPGSKFGCSMLQSGNIWFKNVRVWSERIFELVLIGFEA